MYFDFEDSHPEFNPVGRAISWREGVLLSIIAHMAAVIVVLLFPHFIHWDPVAREAAVLAAAQPHENSTFVFVQPRVDTPAPKPPERGPASDINRMARTPPPVEKPENTQPVARGNTPEPIEQQPPDAGRGRGSDPEPPAGPPQQAEANPVEAQKLPESPAGLVLPPSKPQAQAGNSGRNPFSGDSLRSNIQRFVQSKQFNNQQGGVGQFGPAIQFDTKGVEFGPWIRRFIAQVYANWNVPQAAMSLRGHVVITFNVHRGGALTDVSVIGPCPITSFNTAAAGALIASNPTQPLPPDIRTIRYSSPSRSSTTNSHRSKRRGRRRPSRTDVTRSQQLGLVIVLVIFVAYVFSVSVAEPLVVAILGPTASGKSALALALAERHRGEIVNCDSTAVYRGFDIGTDKVPAGERRGIPHHLIDIAEPTDEYTAAQYARDAARAIRDIHARGRLPLVVGGTGFYYRALTRGLFPGPGRDPALRRRLESIAERRGLPFVHRLLARVDPPSAQRIQPRDLKRMVRALEVFFLTGRPLTAHFADTTSPIPEMRVLPIALRLSAAQTSARVTRRVDEQFGRGLLDEIRDLLARGVPEEARPFGGIVYRQALEHLHGVRDEASTRALIAQENRRYARRQLIWFRKEPNLTWFDGPGELPETIDAVDRLLLKDA